MVPALPPGRKVTVVPTFLTNVPIVSWALALGLAPLVESINEAPEFSVTVPSESVELALEVSDFATVLQVGKSALSGTAADLANDPQVQKAYLGTG